MALVPSNGCIPQTLEVLPGVRANRATLDLNDAHQIIPHPSNAPGTDVEDNRAVNDPGSDESADAFVKTQHDEFPVYCFIGEPTNLYFAAETVIFHQLGQLRSNEPPGL